MLKLLSILFVYLLFTSCDTTIKDNSKSNGIIHKKQILQNDSIDQYVCNNINQYLLDLTNKDFFNNSMVYFSGNKKEVLASNLKTINIDSLDIHEIKFVFDNQIILNKNIAITDHVFIIIDTCNKHIFYRNIFDEIKNDNLNQICMNLIDELNFTEIDTLQVTNDIVKKITIEPKTTSHYFNYPYFREFYLNSHNVLIGFNLQFETGIERFLLKANK